MSKLRRTWLKYLKSEHWRNLRKKAFERDGHKCIKCGTSRRLRGHHKHYRKDLNKCTVKDIETMCQPCHEEHHREQRLLRRENRKYRPTGHIERLIWGHSSKEAEWRMAICL